MAKSKISSDDFLTFLVEDEEPRNLAFHPNDTTKSLKSEKPNETTEKMPGENNSTDILRKTTGNSTDSSTDILRKTREIDGDVNSTDILRKTTGNSTDLKLGDGNSTEAKAEILRNTYGNESEPTKAPILRKTTGNSTDASTDILRKKSKKAHVKSEAKLPDVSRSPRLNQLVGFQRAVFFWIAGEAKKFGQNDSSGNRTTPQINGQILASKIRKPYKSAKDLAYELTVKKYLHRLNDYKTGQNGYSQYLIEKDLYQEWLHAEALENLDQLLSRIERKFYGNPTDASTEILRNFYGNESEPTKAPILRKTTGIPTELSTETSSSMYVGINNTIHTEPKPLQTVAPTELDPWSELREVDFTQLQQWSIKPSIVDTLKKNQWLVDRMQLEDFIEQFVRYFTAPEYEQRRFAIKSPFSIFLNCIKSIARGEAHAISDVPSDYQIQTEIAQKNLIARQEEQKKRLEEIEQFKQEQVEMQFQAWIETMSPEEQVRLVPPQAFAKQGSVGHKQLLREYFIKQIWSQNEHSFLSGPSA